MAKKTSREHKVTVHAKGNANYVQMMELLLVAAVVTTTLVILFTQRII